MPTINQLVKKNRKSKTRKSKSPVLNVGFNTLERKQTDAKSPQKRGVCTKVATRMVKKSMLTFLVKDTTYKNTVLF